ncbi:hypothetical protein GXB85_14490 [Cellulomonas sp. APG4]|uniref:hypothetical protein n=1 Tax=Cellulomonas sp. APG4 TaxID=1538656 RepID=UPI00137A85C4|nr:hypothetical protein [Cellulomonas sp. APG4]NCT92152.1 hypothetical protein [Cellulomonas sp. APG4]
MRIDLERALEDIAGAAGREADAVPVERVLTRLHRRRAARTTMTSAVGVAAAGSVAVGANALLTAPTPPAGPATAPAPTASPAPSADALPAPATDLVPGWVPGEAPCGEPFALTPTDGPRVELTGQVLHGGPDANDLFTPGLGESWALIDVTAVPEVPGQALDTEGAPTTGQHTFLVDDAGTVALWDEPTDEPPIPLKDGTGTNLAGVRDAVDCRTGQPLAGEYRVFAVHGPGEQPWVAGDPGADAEVTELAPVVLGVGAEQHDPWAVPAGAPVCGEKLDDVLARIGEPALRAELDPAAVASTSEAGVAAPVTLTATGDRVVASAPQHLRAFLVDDDGAVVTGVARQGYASPETIDTAQGPFPAEVWQWWDGCQRFDGGARTVDGVPITVGSTYDLYVWDVVDVRTDDGGTRPGTVLGGPWATTIAPW